MLVLDSDVLTLIQRKEGESYERLIARLDAADDEVVTTIITFEEQMRGWLAFIARQSNAERQVAAYQRLHSLVDDFATRPILDFDVSAAAEFDRLRKSKVKIGTMDLKIAAIVIARDAVLLSRNLADFRKIPHLRVENWVD